MVENRNRTNSIKAKVIPIFMENSRKIETNLNVLKSKKKNHKTINPKHSNS